VRSKRPFLKSVQDRCRHFSEESFLKSERSPPATSVNITFGSLSLIKSILANRSTRYLIKKKNEDDQDYHLVLQRSGKILVAEIPNPDCVEDTPEPLKSMIIEARSDLDDWFADHHGEGPVFHQKVSVWGIGMFDTKGCENRSDRLLQVSTKLLRVEITSSLSIAARV
jgi:hypothetical protein